MERASERGQSSAEYIGLVALLAMASAALLALSPAGTVRGLALGICDATGFCDGNPGTLAPLTPAESYEAVLALPLGGFLTLAASDARDERLDWTQDGCSHVPDDAPTFDFRAACARHDFAYRNASLTGGTEDARSAADERFRADMRASCESENPFDRLDCRVWADVYFEGVRRFAADRFGR